MGESHRIEYVYDRAMHRRANRQYLSRWLRRVWWWVPIVVLAIIGFIRGAWLDLQLNWWEGSLLGGLALGAMMLAVIADHRKRRATLATVLPMNMTIVLSDDLLDVSSNEERMAVKWQNVRLIETRDFIVAKRGQLTLVTLPKEHLAAPLLDYLRERAGSK